MTFDLTFFSYGAGLVMLTYIAGMAVGVIWRAMEALSK
jgi:hypothetical protein